LRKLSCIYKTLVPRKHKLLEVITLHYQNDDLGATILDCLKGLARQAKTQKLGLVNLGPNYDIHTLML